MIGVAEIQRSLTAVWRIFLGRPEAMRLLDTSDDGFWRSFQAILIVAPLYALTSMADWNATAATAPAGLEPSGGAFFTSRLIILVLDWVTLPIVLAAIAGFIGIKQTYGAFVVARNWANALAVIPFGAVALLELLGLFPGDSIILPSLVALGFALRLSYMVARTALGFPIDMAIGLVVFDFLLSLAIVTLVSRLFGF